MARKSPASSTSSTVVEEGDGGDGVEVVAGAFIVDDACGREGWRAAVSFAWRFAHRKGESKEGGIDILLFSLLRPWERNE